MDPKLLRAMADMLENPEELARKADQAKDRLFELADKFDQEKPLWADNEDMPAFAYGLTIILSSSLGFLKQIDGLTTLLRIAHWLGKNEGRRLGHKQARAEQLLQNVKLREEEK